MVPQKKKFNINPSVSTPQKIEISSPVVDDSYTLSELRPIVTPEMITSQERSYQISGKCLKLIWGEYIMIIGNLVYILNNLIQNMEDMIQLFQMIMKKTQLLNTFNMMHNHTLMYGPVASKHSN